MHLRCGKSRHLHGPQMTNPFRPKPKGADGFHHHLELQVNALGLLQRSDCASGLTCLAGETRIRLSPVGFKFQSELFSPFRHQLVEDMRNPLFDMLWHGDRPPPFACCFARPLVGGIEPHLSAQAADGRREIQVIDWCLLH